MKEGRIKDLYELIIKEVQTIRTMIYVISVGIGILFNYQKYSEFGIHIFDYADVFDFLIAPFSDLYIVLFTTVSIAFVCKLYLLDLFWRKKFPKSYSLIYFKNDKKPWFSGFLKIMYVTTAVLYIYITLVFYGD